MKGKDLQDCSDVISQLFIQNQTLTSKDSFLLLEEKESMNIY